VYDVIVVGGSYSGMAAALQLLRARRTVLIIDAGRRRNRKTSTSHGFLTQDGVDPAKIASTARAQLAAYPTLTWLNAAATDAESAEKSFSVTTSDGAQHGGKRLIFATGVSDTLPEIPGLAERWGTSVFHCPYCHGYELDRGRIGVIATGPNSLHQALLLREWGEVTFFLNGAFEPDDAASATLAERGILVEASKILRFENHANVCLEDGRSLSFAGFFTASRTAPATPLAEQLGCELEATPFGTQVRTDGGKQTTVSGAFACGDAAHMPHSLTGAVGDGALTGLHVHRSLVFQAS
jgi:thioredoxin reductase